MKKLTLLLALCVFAFFTMAPIIPPPPPPPDIDCSPGFYKNHTELWVDVCCVAEECDSLLADLQARGPGSNEIREAAQDVLGQCFAAMGYSPCADD